MAVGAIFFSIFDWWRNSHGHSDIQLAKAAARKTPVLFVNSIGMRIPHGGNSTAPLRRIARKLGSMARRTTPIDASLLVTTPVAFPAYRGLGEAVSRRLITRQIAGAATRLDLDRPTVFVTVPTFAKVALAIPRRSLVYLRSDLHSAYPGVDQAMVRAYEQILFDRADVIAYSSRSLFEREASALGARARYVGHGVDRTRFSPVGDQDPEIMRLPRPRVGFFGGLRDFVDFDLVAEVARRLPDVHFILGGPRLEDPAQLKPCPNVHVLDACPHERMPARWRSVDVAMLPYRRNAWVEAIEPIKLGEILATGLKAVGTPLPSLRAHPGQIVTAADADAFAGAIRHLLESRARAPRLASAAVDFRSWDDIAAELLADAPWPELGATPRRHGAST